MATFKRNALGRGLDALITMDEVKTEGSSSINEIEISKIKPNPDQPRREFDQEALSELATSIRELGIIQPISLRQISDGTYQIIAGERRYRASIMAGLKTIPAYVRTAEDDRHQYHRQGDGFLDQRDDDKDGDDGDGVDRKYSTGRFEFYRNRIDVSEIDRTV